VNGKTCVKKTLDPRFRGDDTLFASFPRKREPSGVRGTTVAFQKTLDPRFRGDDASASSEFRQPLYLNAFQSKRIEFESMAVAVDSVFGPLTIDICLLRAPRYGTKPW
jgi:hypothetical protein